MTLLLASAARATVGGRSGQEDAFRLWPAEGAVPPKSESGGLLAVMADGIGGHTGGADTGRINRHASGPRILRPDASIIT